MSFTKINNSDFNDYGALSMTNRPSETKTAQQIKTLFDAPARQVIAPAYNRLIDELEASAAATSIGAEAPTGRTVSNPTVQADINKLSSDLATVEGQIAEAVADAHTHDNKALLDTYEQTEADLASAVTNTHTHNNKAVIDKFGESDGKPTYDSQVIGSDVSSVNGKTGEVTLVASDVGALPDNTTIPDELADLTDDSTHRLVTDTEKTSWNGKSTVSVTQIKSSGEKIATVTIDGVATDIYAAAGGSGTGDMTKAVYDDDDTVANAGGIVAYVQGEITDQITDALTASY